MRGSGQKDTRGYYMLKLVFKEKITRDALVKKLEELEVKNKFLILEADFCESLSPVEIRICIGYAQNCREYKSHLAALVSFLALEKEFEKAINKVGFREGNVAYLLCLDEKSYTACIKGLRNFCKELAEEHFTFVEKTNFNKLEAYAKFYLEEFA